MNDGWYGALKDAIQQQQNQLVWVSEGKVRAALSASPKQSGEAPPAFLVWGEKIRHSQWEIWSLPDSKFSQ